MRTHFLPSVIARMPPGIRGNLVAVLAVAGENPSYADEIATLRSQ